MTTLLVDGPEKRQTFVAEPGIYECQSCYSVLDMEESPGLYETDGRGKRHTIKMCWSMCPVCTRETAKERTRLLVRYGRVKSFWFRVGRWLGAQ